MEDERFPKGFFVNVYNSEGLVSFIAVAETWKAKERRIKDGFFDKYCNGRGIDIGCRSDVLLPTCDLWDLTISPDMDAKFMAGIKDETYDFVYSSHCLEDIDEPKVALINWYRILKPGGYLILFIPHRDLFERVHFLPSPCNKDHKHFFLIDKHEAPHTLGIIPLITEVLTNYELLYVKKCDDGYKCTYMDRGNGFFSLLIEGECSIELVLKKGNLTQYFN